MIGSIVSNVRIRAVEFLKIFENQTNFKENGNMKNGLGLLGSVFFTDR